LDLALEGRVILFKNGEDRKEKEEDTITFHISIIDPHTPSPATKDAAEYRLGRALVERG